MVVSAAEMLQKAREGKYAVAQININNLEWAKSVLQVVEELQSPIILGVSEGAGKYMAGYKTIVGMVNGMLEEMKISVPVTMRIWRCIHFRIVCCRRKSFLPATMI